MQLVLVQFDPHPWIGRIAPAVALQLTLQSPVPHMSVSPPHEPPPVQLISQGADEGHATVTPWHEVSPEHETEHGRSGAHFSTWMQLVVQSISQVPFPQPLEQSLGQAGALELEADDDEPLVDVLPLGPVWDVVLVVEPSPASGELLPEEDPTELDELDPDTVPVT
jgi:hypothetical protein